MEWHFAGCSTAPFDGNPGCQTTSAPTMIHFIGFGQWQANLRILEVTEIKIVPYVLLSHPFVERLIGTIRREYLDRMLFWTTADLENKLLDFQDYYNHHRTHSARAGCTPQETSGPKGPSELRLLPMATTLWRFISNAHCRLTPDHQTLKNSNELSMNEKIAWSGAVTSVQPRIRLTRSFDERSHTYLGYLLRIEGTVGGVSAEFRVGIGSGTHAKHPFRMGDRVEGLGHRVAGPRLETADIYRVSKLKLIRREKSRLSGTMAWSASSVARLDARRHRRLAVATYDSKCNSCIWSCAMAVEMIIDQWNSDRRRYRTEPFCYGPLSCSSYKPGPTRKVPVATA